MTWLYAELDAFLKGKGRSTILGWVAIAVTFLVGKYALSRFATLDEILSLTNYIAAAAILAVTHWLDLHIGNANVKIPPPPDTPKEK